MRMVFAFCVGGWVIRVVFAFIDKDVLSLSQLALILGGCAFGAIMSGWVPGLLGWLGLSIGGEVVAMELMHLPVSAVQCTVTALFIAVALFFGNTFARS